MANSQHTKQTASVAEAAVLMASYLQRVATGPKQSKPLSQQEAYQAMVLILQDKADPVRAGILLIALRMKRETDEEHLGALQALQETMHTATAPVPTLIDLGDPYNGMVRYQPLALFLAPLLAAGGLPTVIHGLEKVAPKYGITHRQVLRHLGGPVDLSPSQVADAIGEYGWGYVDQRHFAPKLHQLIGLRGLMVKRTVLTTLETGLRPIRGQQKTHWVTGYVHKPYPPIYSLIAQAAGFDSALIIRGYEGGVLPSLRQKASYHQWHQGQLQAHEFTLQQLGLDKPVLPPAIVSSELPHYQPRWVAATADSGLKVLQGKVDTPAGQWLMVAAGMIFHHYRQADSIAEGMELARDVLLAGNALKAFEGFVSHPPVGG